MRKRLLSLIIVLCLAFGMIPTVSASEIASGTCGENLTWVLTDDGTLTIKGEGRMDNYSSGGPHAPWNDQLGSIEFVIISDGITSIGSCAFRQCYNLKKITLPDTLVHIGYNAFDWCPDLTDITLPSSLTTIGSQAFRDCDSLTSISIPEKVTKIDDETFMDCAILEKVELPESITHIGYYAFALSQLTDINIPDTATHVDRTAFYWTPWAEKLSGGYVIVGDHILLGYYDKEPLIGTAVIPDGVKYVAPHAFAGNYKIDQVKLPNSLIEIGHWAFESTSISSITIPSSVSYIAGGAFQECPNLNTVYFVGNAPTMEEDIFADDSLTAYYPQNNPTWTSDMLLDYDGTTTWVGYTSFDDVPSDAFYFAPVVWASNNGITTGAAEDAFDPNGKCLRAHVVTFLHRAAENPEPTSTKNPFTDVKSSDFFYKPVLWAVEQKITNGISADKFGSYDVCNRAAVVTFLWRAAGSPEPASDDNPFKDVKPTDFFYKPVLWAVENGITNGLTATEFGPGAACNRAQVVTFLYRAYND